MDRIDWAALSLAVGIVSFQIFVPLVIGLADNGDFVKTTGRFDLYLPSGQAVAGCVLFLLIVATRRQLGLDRRWLLSIAGAAALVRHRLVRNALGLL